MNNSIQISAEEFLYKVGLEFFKYPLIMRNMGHSTIQGHLEYCKGPNKDLFSNMFLDWATEVNFKTKQEKFNKLIDSYYGGEEQSYKSFALLIENSFKFLTDNE